MEGGYIKLFRKITEWEWYNDNNVFRVFIHLLLTANHKEKTWQGQIIKKGQKITSLANLFDETGLTVKQIRVALDKLKRTNEITIKTTNKYSVVTLTKYSDYQDEDFKKGKQKGKQQDNQRATNKNGKNNIINTSCEKSSHKYITEYFCQKFLEELS